MRSWSAFNDWNIRSALHSRIWVGRLVRYVMETGLADQACAILDYGCGSFDFGVGVSTYCLRVDGFDPHPSSAAQASLQASKLKNAKIYSSEHAIPEKSYDVVIVNSVIQYMNSTEDLEGFFKRCSSYLKPSGKRALLIADIIPTAYSPYLDALDALGIALRHGFFIEMLGHLIKSAANRNDARFSRLDQEKLARIAAGFGFRPHFLPENLTPSRRRYTCLLTLNPMAPPC